MISWLKPAAFAAPLPLVQVAPTYRRLRRRVFLGIFAGYAAYYLVRNNLALAIPDILRDHPQYSKAGLGSALTGLLSPVPALREAASPNLPMLPSLFVSATAS